MVQLSNVPQQVTTLRLAKDMAFSLGLWFRTKDQGRQFGSPILPIPADYQGIDITDDEIRFVVYNMGRYGTSTVINEVATLVEPEHGYARVDLQTADTALLMAGRTYGFSVGWLADDYAGVVVQGELECVGNGIDDWILSEYTIDAPLNLGVELDERNHIHVVVDHMRAPDISIGSVTTLPALEDAGAYFTGSYPHQLLHLRLPRGIGGDPPGLSIGEVTVGDNENDGDVELVPDGPGEYIMNFRLPKSAQAGGTVYLDSYPLIQGNGVDDDQPEIQAILTAMEALGGGTVELGVADYFLGADLQIGNGVWVTGLGREVSRFILDVGVRIRCGVWGDGDRPGGLVKIGVDGNTTGGHDDGAIQFQSVFAQMLFCKVQDVAGHGVLLDAAQNANVIGNYVVNAAGAALAIRNGSGGYNFMGSHFTSSAKDLLIYDEDGVANNAYPFGSAHIQFWGGIFESYADGEMIFDIRCGGALHFWGTGFSVNGAIVMSEGVVGRISNADMPVSTYAEFNGCTWNGGTNEYVGLEIDGNEYVTFSGENYIQKHTTFCMVTDGSPRIQQLGFFSGKTDVGEIFGASGAGSLVSLYNEKTVNNDFIMPLTRTTIESARVEGDTGQRYRRDAYGNQYWNAGDDFGSQIEQLVDTVNDFMYINKGGLYLGQRLGRMHPAYAFPNGAVAINTKTTNIYKAILTGAGHISSMDIQNAIEGTELRVILAYNEGGQAVVWDPDILWPTGVAPETGEAGSMTVVDMFYDDDYGKWIAYNVATQIPLTGNTYARPAVYQYTAAQTDTALPIPKGAKFGRIRCASGGQGGGSGRRGAAGAARTGGGGGAGGAYSQVDFRVADLAVSTLYVTVGAGGAGGAAVAVNDTNGNPGSQGGDSAVKTAAGAVTYANCLAHALSSSVSSTVPGGGLAAVAAAGGVGGFGERLGMNGGASNAAGGAGSGGVLTGGSANAGGGAGGGISAANAAAAGGAGGWAYGRGLVQAAGGTAGNPGAAGDNGPTLGLGQGGGGGGGNGGAGGAGGRGAGGGGGGASLNGAASGAGGAGGTGFVEVTFWFN